MGNERNWSEGERDALECRRPDEVQPGTSRFDRAFDAANGIAPLEPTARELVAALRVRAEAIRAGDSLTARHLEQAASRIERMLREAAVEAAFHADAFRRSP